MREPKFRRLVSQLTSANPAHQTAARMILVSMQEDAILPLSDEYYAGITDAEGAAILEVMAEIGGYDALAVLRNIYTFEDARPVLKHAAAKGLLRNADNLSQHEREEIALFFANLG